MGSLKSRVERLEKEVFGVDIKKPKKCYVKMEIKDILGKTQGEIFQGNFSIKKFFVDGDINNRAKIILARKHQFDVEKIIWESILGEDDVNEVMNEFFRIKGSQISDEIKAAIKKDVESRKEVFTKDWEISYQLKPEINLTTSTLTLGTTINVFNAKDSKVVKNAKKMGLLDLWFNKVIR